MNKDRIKGSGGRGCYLMAPTVNPLTNRSTKKL
jgi:hypothetical protein